MPTGLFFEVNLSSYLALQMRCHVDSGAVNNLFQLATTTGILVAQLVNYGVHRAGPWAWRVSLAVAGCCFSTFQLNAFTGVYVSPCSVLRHNYGSMSPA